MGLKTSRKINLWVRKSRLERYIYKIFHLEQKMEKSGMSDG